MGGWITMAQYCSRGLSPWPSGGLQGTGAPPACDTPMASKGLATKLLTSRKKVVTMATTPTTQGIRTGFLLRWTRTVTMEKRVRIQHQKRSDPSCPPHSAPTL